MVQIQDMDLHRSNAKTVDPRPGAFGLQISGTRHVRLPPRGSSHCHVLGSNPLSQSPEGRRALRSIVNEPSPVSLIDKFIRQHAKTAKYRDRNDCYRITLPSRAQKVPYRQSSPVMRTPPLTSVCRSECEHACPPAHSVRLPQVAPGIRALRRLHTEAHCSLASSVC